jgi:hypothetical protein
MNKTQIIRLVIKRKSCIFKTYVFKFLKKPKVEYQIIDNVNESYSKQEINNFFDRAIKIVYIIDSLHELKHFEMLYEDLNNINHNKNDYDSEENNTYFTNNYNNYTCLRDLKIIRHRCEIDYLQLSINKSYLNKLILIKSNDDLMLKYQQLYHYKYDFKKFKNYYSLGKCFKSENLFKNVYLSCKIFCNQMTNDTHDSHDFEQNI